MTYITEPGQKPKTLQEAFNECPFEELSGFMGDAFDADVIFFCKTEAEKFYQEFLDRGSKYV